jgi:hypothetical protein
MISMFSLAMRVMTKYKILLVKMGLDMPTNFLIATNFDSLVYLNILLSFPYIILLSFSCILHVLELVHTLIKISQVKNILVCKFIVAIKSYQARLYSLFINPTTKFGPNSCHKYHSLLACVHESIIIWWI